MALTVFMTTICSQTSVKVADKVYKNVGLIFKNQQGNIVKSFTKNIVENETLGQLLGDEYPTLDADPVHGNFTGWYSRDLLYDGKNTKRTPQ